jgi:Fe-Mn family superoxide dismutase
MEACRRIRAWCRQAQHLVAQGLSDQHIGYPLRTTLLGWSHALGSLQREAEWHLRAATAGLYNPVTMAHLLGKAQQTMAEFAALSQGNRMSESERMAKSMELEAAVPIGQHKLPPLPYAYDALEPYIDAQTMRIHHDKHHQSYVDGLNKAEKMMAQARESGDFDLIKHWEREAAFNGAGHYLHTIFWNIMTPTGALVPSGALAEQIQRDFGSFDRFKKHFSAAAEKVEGGGWALLVWSPRSHRLEILQAEKHQNLSQWDVIPLLVLDVWEHAYYLKYQNDRKAYIDAWWHIVNWEHVAERFNRASKLVWEPY